MVDHNFTKELSDPSNSDNRSQLSSITVDKSANDVYNWRKYGQKEVKGSEYPRSYYRCSHPNCLAKKKVEHSVEGLVTNIIYRGQHNHQPLQAERGKDTGLGTSNEYEQGLEGQTGNFKDQEYTQATYEQSGLSDCEEVDDDPTRMDERHEDEPEGKRRNIEFGTLDPVSSHRRVREPRTTFKTTSEVDVLDDGFRWRKYGQKPVKGSPFPRSYYKCTNRGCPARKHVERDASDPKAVITTNEGKHNHDMPAATYSSHTMASASSTITSQKGIHIDTDLRLTTSSSLTPPSTLVSSSRLSNYDVFLSFRGNDVDKTFVDHIYSTLLQKGIHTYMEGDTYHGGESITPLHLKVIRESHIVVVIFSKRYAKSSWCLSELAYVMETKDEFGQIVMPVFYGVEPAQFLLGSGSFFGTHESIIKDDRPWRKALWDAAHLSSWTENDVMNGTKFIKTIVDTISRRLLPSTPNDNTRQIGIKSRIQDLKAQLQVGISGVHMVGIAGIWGSGKSILASSIYDEIRHEFDGCCFVKNVCAQSRLHGLKKLQEKILSKVLKLRKVVLGSIEEGISMMTSRLSCISVLIVLDDVDHLDQLKMLAGSQDWFGQGSRIIIITRNKDLLNAHNINMIYNVRLLNEEEAIELFCMHAFRARSPVEDYEKLDYEKLTRDMVSKFGGHPSSLVSLASFLRDKDIREWFNTSAKLEDVPDDETMELFDTGDDGVQNNIYSWLGVKDETMEESKAGDDGVQTHMRSWLGVEEVGMEM